MNQKIDKDMKAATRKPLFKRQKGFTMIEMMVSMALGLVVTGAVLYTVSGATNSGRKQDMQARMYDMGQMALNQLTEHVRMAGFWVPISEVSASDALLDDELTLFGCSGGFSNPGADWNALSCTATSASGTTNDALALRFQVQPDGRNWDCTGNELQNAAMVAQATAQATRSGGAAPTYAPGTTQDVIEERYYIANSATGNPGLFCRSNVSNRQEQIADNIEQFRVRYGVSPLNPKANTHNVVFDERALEGRTGSYLPASALDRNCSSLNAKADSWCSVSSVRICVVIRSDDNVNDQTGVPYIDCDGVQRTANDRRFRQAFTTTVAIRNRVAMP